MSLGGRIVGLVGLPRVIVGSSSWLVTVDWGGKFVRHVFAEFSAGEADGCSEVEGFINILSPCLMWRCGIGHITFFHQLLCGGWGNFHDNNNIKNSVFVKLFIQDPSR